MYDLQAVIDKQPSSQALAHIRDLDMRIEGCPSLTQDPNQLWGCAGEGGLSGLLKGLIQQMKTKRSCYIKFHNLSNPKLGPELLEALEALQEFESVAMEFIRVDGDWIEPYAPMVWQTLVRKRCLELEDQVQEKLRPAGGGGPGPVLTFRYRLQCLSGELLEL